MIGKILLGCVILAVTILLSKAISAFFRWRCKRSDATMTIIMMAFMWVAHAILWYSMVIVLGEVFGL